MQTLASRVFANFFLIFSLAVVSLAQTGSIYELPSGTLISVRMDNGISSRFSSPKDTFTATVVEPVVIREYVVLPAGSVVDGTVTEVIRAGAGGRSGMLAVRFTSLKLPGSVRRDIDGILLEELKARRSTPKVVTPIAAGAGLGTLIGALSGRGRGALIGSGIGAGIGSAVTLARSGQDVSIATNEIFTIKLINRVVLPVRDF